MEPKPIACIRCDAMGTKTVRGDSLHYPDGWMMFEGRTSTSRNREIWLCDTCGKGVPERPSMLDSISR